MANTFSANVSEEFDVQAMAQELVELYQSKGYTARTVKMKNGARITIEKGRGGLNTVLGLSEGITATVTKQGSDVLMVNFSDGDWVSKIIGFAVGLLCCLPFITAIVGTIRQLSLPKNVENDICALVSE